MAKRKSPPKQWDILTKMLMHASPQDLVSWLLPDAVYQGELNVELQKKPPIFADLLYTVKCAEEQAVLHVEFQHGRDDKMDKRLWEYNCSAWMHTGLPVYSVVIYLLKDSPIVEPPYKMKWPTGLTIHHFYFENIKMWEIPGELLKQQELSGLLPLLPLTLDGKRREVVEETIECLQQAGKADLLPLVYAFSALMFKKKKEQQWLKERFDIMGSILEESWAYQEMVQKGVAKGLKQGEQKGLKHSVVRFVELHFPVLVPLAKKKVAQAKSSQKLQKMLDHLFVAHTDDEARAVLLGEQE